MLQGQWRLGHSPCHWLQLLAILLNSTRTLMSQIRTAASLTIAPYPNDTRTGTWNSRYSLLFLLLSSITTSNLTLLLLIHNTKIPRLREQLYEFRMMSFPYFRESMEGRCLFAILITLLLINSGINVYFSYLIRDFSTALATKEVNTFYRIMGKFMISMILLIPLQVSFRFIRVRLAISWRKWLTARVLTLYFSNKVRNDIPTCMSLVMSNS